MKTNPIRVAATAKGPFALLQRIHSITGRYGLTPDRMDQALKLFSEVLCRFDCGATFPITAVTLQRHSNIIKKYLNKNTEFAVHGYTHVDYARLTAEEQLAHLHLACDIFIKAGIPALGFRSPYLRRESHLYAAIKDAGFSYVSNQPILWNVLDKDALTPSTNTNYERALTFYEPWQATERVSIPQVCNQFLEIPIALPDDEMLVERLGLTNGFIEKSWRRILAQTYQQGELFVLQLHPERIAVCVNALEAVLSEARTCTPAVWCARLDEVAAWWKARSSATIEITDTLDGGYHCVVSGPNNTTVLVRGVDLDVRTLPWASGYRQVEDLCFTIHAPIRPFIGVSPSGSSALSHFLQQQGYIVEISEQSNHYECYFDQVNFDTSRERQILAQIEMCDCPLVRLGRWPNGAKSALAITGDIDAVTLWDYGLRLIGK